MEVKKRNIVIAIMVAMFLGAVEGTVVTTAMPTIVRELHGFPLMSWVFSIYLLASAVSTPIYGKLADLYGRKNTLSVGIIIFLGGSILCGLSGNMVHLIIFRGLQGLGAGAIFTVTYTIIGDIFQIGERAKVQGWLGTVWGIASLAGPFLGGFLIDYLSWHWIFFINVPFGILSLIILQRSLDEGIERKKHQIDFLGIGVLSLAIMALLIGVLWLGNSQEKNMLFAYISLISAVILTVILYFVERIAKEPVIPLGIITRNNIVVNVISFLVSAVLIGADVYLPVYIQNVLGHKATLSGLAMAPMSISWLMASVLLAKAIPRYGERLVTEFSTFIILVSCLLLPVLGLHSSLLMVVIFVFIMGIGFGGSFTTLTIVVQESVGYRQRGAATAFNSLIRTLGQTIGVSIFGTVFNLKIVQYFDHLGIRDIDPANLYTQANTRTGTNLDMVKEALNFSLHQVFFALIVLSVLSLIFSFSLSSRLRETKLTSLEQMTRGRGC
ncbi:MAG: MDR family MFS transporter [Dehalobacterium sp.]